MTKDLSADAKNFEQFRRIQEIHLIVVSLVIPSQDKIRGWGLLKRYRHFRRGQLEV
jgi:hypothetical protein